jgi:hypothetical protein
MSDDIRKIIYMIRIHFTDGTTAPITVATADKGALPDLIEKNKRWYERTGKVIHNWKLEGEKMLFHLTPEEYEEELSFTDVVDEVV